MNSKFNTATFALGCFWHSDALFGCQKGVYRTRCGYTSGTLRNPTYKNLGDHTEAVQIDYDPAETNYETLLSHFWKNHDPTHPYKRQYRSAIFYLNDEEKTLAMESKKRREEEVGKSLYTDIEPLKEFYNAENYHQKYFLQTHHKKLFKNLGIKEKDLLSSTLAAKLNGYIVGQNTLATFNSDCDSFGLSAEDADYVRKMIAKGKQGHC